MTKEEAERYQERMNMLQLKYRRTASVDHLNNGLPDMDPPVNYSPSSESQFSNSVHGSQRDSLCDNSQVPIKLRSDPIVLSDDNSLYISESSRNSVAQNSVSDGSDDDIPVVLKDARVPDKEGEVEKGKLISQSHSIPVRLKRTKTFGVTSNFAKIPHNPI